MNTEMTNLVFNTNDCSFLTRMLSTKVYRLFCRLRYLLLDTIVLLVQKNDTDGMNK